MLNPYTLFVLLAPFLILNFIFGFLDHGKFLSAPGLGAGNASSGAAGGVCMAGSVSTQQYKAQYNSVVLYSLACCGKFIACH